VLALLAVMLATWGWESYWRGVGFRPDFLDDARLWAHERGRASSGNPDTIILLGSSKLQAAVDLDVFAATAGGAKPIQLALTGSSPLPILEDLAADDRFVGIGVAELSPLGFFDSSGSSEDLPREMLAHYRAFRAGPFHRLEHRLSSLVQRHAVFRVSLLSPRHVLGEALRGGRPAVNPLRVGSDRSIQFQFDERTRVPAAVGLSALGRAPIATGAEADATIERLSAAAKTIRRRGGEVALVFFDCQGPYREEIQGRYPLRQYWQRAVDHSRSIPLDLAIRPELQALGCPDGVHLAASERATFTRSLAEMLEAELAPRR